MDGQVVGARGWWPSADALAGFVEHVPLPRITLFGRTATSPVLADVGEATRRALARVLEGAHRPPGPVAVGVGSRGMADLPLIVATVVVGLREAGWEPFVVPAMGSHGGATAAGQVEALAGLGVTEAGVGAPVRASLEVDEVGTAGDVHVFVDRLAHRAGAVLLVNRVKPHTDFHGAIESGPAKMIAIGLGHLAGAAELHAAGPDGLRAGIPAAARLVAGSGLVLGAVATVENEVGRTALVEGLLAGEIAGEAEEELLKKARALMPRLPFDDLDVLVVQRLGKDISGEGVDPNVIGRTYITGVPEPARPRVRCIAALGLTEASEGNALGVGLTDVVSARLAAAIDLEAMYANALTAGLVDVMRAKLPIVMANDRLAVKAAIACCGRRDPATARLLWIADTEHLEVVGTSETLAAEAAGRDDLERVGPAHAMTFDAEGALEPFARVT